MGNKTLNGDLGNQQHQRLGSIKITQAQDAQTHQIFAAMQISRSLESQKLVESWMKDISQIDDFQAREVLLLPLKHTFEKAGICGSTGILHITYENYSFILEKEIKNRLGLNKFFLETEMWYLLYNMIRAGNKFQKIKKKIGDIHPFNILINDDGQVKLISTCSFPNEQNNFNKIVENKQANVFLAPEQLDQSAISKGEYPSNIDPCRAQVFSIGLTLLSSATLQNCNNLYDKNKGLRISNERIQRLLSSISQRYSPLLTQTIAGMLNFDSHQRRRCVQIYQMLFPYQNQILQLEPFSLPTKVSNVQNSFKGRLAPGSQLHYSHQGYPQTQNVNPQYQRISQTYSGPSHQPVGQYQTGYKY